ncbi:hypothetical protein P7K49_038559 [Saguinus oedipus]|uniref:WW domain binding protein 11 n=1 Tax=Saguinus oedipus TaxID=9490 RepID=A0ABQ9TF00_SAGOE|nr:hypothetical protein P7K49_038559 [Saguinus oedipus]
MKPLNVFYDSMKKRTDIYKELRKLEIEYEQKRAQLSQYFDAVKNAQHVEVESIPLPDMPHASSNILIQDIPLLGAHPPSILKKPQPMDLQFGQFLSVLFLDMVFHGCPLAENLLALPWSTSSTSRAEVWLTSEDDNHPEGMDQDKHDDSTDDSDTDKSDGESEGDEFVHRDDGERQQRRKEVRSECMVCRYARKSRKKKKTMKELTPLQAMMLRMAGQEIPEEGREVEEFSEDDDEDDSDDSEAEKQSQKQHKEESYSDGTSTPSSQQQAPPQFVPPSQIQAPPMPEPAPILPPPAPPLRPPGPPTGLPPGPPPGAPPFLRPPGMPGL